MSPMEAQDFGIIDKVLVHPPQAGQDEPELIQKSPPALQAPPPPHNHKPLSRASPAATLPPHTNLNPERDSQQERVNYCVTGSVSVLADV